MFVLFSVNAHVLVLNKRKNHANRKITSFVGKQTYTKLHIGNVFFLAKPFDCSAPILAQRLRALRGV